MLRPRPVCESVLRRFARLRCLAAVHLQLRQHFGGKLAEVGIFRLAHRFIEQRHGFLVRRHHLQAVPVVKLLAAFFLLESIEQDLVMFEKFGRQLTFLVVARTVNFWPASA